jgi:hypothetical protein
MPLTNPSLSVIEPALDSSCLWAAMAGGGYWRCRRNGTTQLDKSKPSYFRIPIKVGLRQTGSIVNDKISLAAFGEPAWQDADFVISTIDPNFLPKGS